MPAPEPRPGAPGITIYEGERGRVEVALRGDTVWLNLQQLAERFGRDKSVISRHLRYLFRSGELERDAAVAKNATTVAVGKIRSDRPPHPELAGAWR